MSGRRGAKPAQRIVNLSEDVVLRLDLRVVIPDTGEPAEGAENERLAVGVPEAARLLSCSEDVVYRLMDTMIEIDGELRPALPNLRISKRRLVVRQGLEELCARAMAGWDPSAAMTELVRLRSVS